MEYVIEGGFLRVFHPSTDGDCCIVEFLDGAQRVTHREQWNLIDNKWRLIYDSRMSDGASRVPADQLQAQAEAEALRAQKKKGK